MSMEIPGLIAKQDKSSNLTEAEKQAKRDSFEAYIKNWKSEEDMLKKMAQLPIEFDKESLQLKRLNPNPISSAYVGGIDPYQDMWQNPNTFTSPNWEWQNPGPFGPIDGGLRPSPNRSGQLQTQDMADYLQAMLKPKKSEFEVLLDAMFDTSEKEQFLITLGFEFKHENGEDWMERTVAGLLEKGKKAEIFDKVFLREMTIKFKNLLISKNSLKLKI